MRGVRNSKLEKMTDALIIDAVRRAGGLNKAAAMLGIPGRTFKDRASPLLKNTMLSRKVEKPIPVMAPRRGKKCFIFSSAQNGTEIHEAFLTNLEAYAKHLSAEIHISGFTYNKALFEDHSKHQADFHERVRPYLTDRRFDIAGKLLFCGEMNTLPTADQPLSGFEAYTRSQWGIFPHPKVQLVSVATMFRSPPKIIMTTGAITKPNYVRKKVGIKAEFHHMFGAVLVEVDDDGDFFCRHLLAEKDGTFQDLDVRVDAGKVTQGHRVEAITWGDIHAERLDPKVALAAWGIDASTLDAKSPVSMLDDLKPKVQFFHDVLDFRRRNHHNVKDPHFMFEMWAKGTERVEAEIAKVAEFLLATQRPFCDSVVVDSNHDRALRRWLRDADYRYDPANARFFLQCQAALYKAIEDGEENFLIIEWAVRQAAKLEATIFLHNTDTYVICRQAGGGIECALHGDQGANGAKAVINTFARMGPKANIADKHGAGIFEGIYQAGHSCKRDMVYNRGGLSSWNPSHIVTLPSGKRQMVTMQGTKYRA